MSAARIQTVANAIAAKLEALPDITSFYPYIREISTLEDGEGAMAPVGFTIPETMGAITSQQVTWEGVVRFQSSLTSPSGGEELTKKIINLCSADPTVGIIGTLRAWSREDDKRYGHPRVTEDGIDPDYDEEMDESLVTLLPFQVMAQVLMAPE